MASFDCTFVSNFLPLYNKNSIRNNTKIYTGIFANCTYEKKAIINNNEADKTSSKFIFLTVIKLSYTLLVCILTATIVCQIKIE